MLRSPLASAADEAIRIDFRFGGNDYISPTVIRRSDNKLNFC